MMISLRPQSINFQSSWETNCYQQLKSLFHQNSYDKNSLSAIKLYSNIYELCIAFPENHTMSLLKNISQLFFDAAIEIRQNMLAVNSGSADALLELYVKEWNRYCLAFKAINGVCRYLNKCLKSNYETAQYPNTSNEGMMFSPGLHFQPVVIQLGSSRAERIELKIVGIQDVAKSVWNNVIIRYFREKESNYLINNFLSVLRIESGNRNNLKAFIESFKWCDDMSLLEMVEEDTKEYYSKCSREFIENNSTSNYVKFATEQLSKESERTEYLWVSDAEAVKIVLRVCENELIENHKSKLQDEFERMLRFERISELNLLFKLLCKNEGTIAALQQSLNQVILKEFDVNYNSTLSSDEVIKGILEVYKKYTKFIKLAFDDDYLMMKTLEDSMDQIINYKIKRSWTIFSNFLDEILKARISITEDMTKILKLFTLRTESFEEFVNEFKDKLSQRIIFSGIDLVSEELVIEIFKCSEKLSPEQNCHLKRMLLDFKEKGARDQSDSVLVLTSHAWPTSCNPTNMNESTIPDSLKSIMKEFEFKYRKNHCGRKVQWCPQLITLESGNGTLMTLLQYQIIDALPFGINLMEIVGKLDVPLTDFNANFKILQDHEIIKFDSLSEEFKYINLPGNLNLIPVRESEVAVIGVLSSENSKQSMEIDSSRQVRQSFILQSLISMILKRQRQTSPAELKKLLMTAAACMNHGHAFIPQDDEIDAAINGLIGKGYLEFNDQENLYIYVA